MSECVHSKQRNELKFVCGEAMKLNKTHLLLSVLTLSMKSFMELPNVVNVEK